MKKPAKQKASHYDDSRHPLYFPRDQWLNSQLSIARHWGACTYNGVRYEVDELTEDLCREDVALARRTAYTDADKATIRAKYLALHQA
jgi:hypothetical protein